MTLAIAEGVSNRVSPLVGKNMSRPTSPRLSSVTRKRTIGGTSATFRSWAVSIIVGGVERLPVEDGRVGLAAQVVAVGNDPLLADCEKSIAPSARSVRFDEKGFHLGAKRREDRDDRVEEGLVGARGAVRDQHIGGVGREEVAELRVVVAVLGIDVDRVGRVLQEERGGAWPGRSARRAAGSARAGPPVSASEALPTVTALNRNAVFRPRSSPAALGLVVVAGAGELRKALRLQARVAAVAVVVEIAVIAGRRPFAEPGVEPVGERSLAAADDWQAGSSGNWNRLRNTPKRGSQPVLAALTGATPSPTSAAAIGFAFAFARVGFCLAAATRSWKRGSSRSESKAAVLLQRPAGQATGDGAGQCRKASSGGLPPQAARRDCSGIPPHPGNAMSVRQGGLAPRGVASLEQGRDGALALDDGGDVEDGDRRGLLGGGRTPSPGPPSVAGQRCAKATARTAARAKACKDRASSALSVGTFPRACGRSPTRGRCVRP